MIDTHSHIQFKAFDKNRDDVIKRAKEVGLKKIIAVGTDLISSKEAVKVAEKYPDVFASIGIHPHHVFDFLEDNKSDVIAISRSEEAISERTARPPSERDCRVGQGLLAMTLL